MKPRVFLETTIPSYLTAWPSRDLVRMGQQQLTREWWERRGEFELYSSRLVVDECRGGDPQAAADRLAALAGVTLLAQTPEVVTLAEVLADEMQLPEKAEPDAYHIATAAFHGMDYLLTWNCRHIANANFWPGIEAVCRSAGYHPPHICSPDQLQPPGVT